MSLYTSLGKYANGHKAKEGPKSDRQYRPDLGFLSGLRVVDFGVCVIINWRGMHRKVLNVRRWKEVLVRTIWYYQTHQSEARKNYEIKWKMVLQCNCVITCISILDYFYLYKKMMPFDVLRVILWNLFHKITLPPIHGIKPHRFTLCTYGAYPLGFKTLLWWTIQDSKTNSYIS